MKKLFLGFVFLLTSLSSVNAYAAQWFIRDGGGTAAQCDGHTDHVLAGATGTNCAVYNPHFIGGAGCGNFGGGSCDRAKLWGSGDTITIHGDSDITPGTQAQYPIGLDSTGVITPNNSSNCTPSSSGADNCTLSNLPANATLTYTGTHHPQLWGREHLEQVLNAHNDGWTINGMEITDHHPCGFGTPIGGTIDGLAIQCPGNGPWAKDGVAIGGTGDTFTNNYVHGMARTGLTSSNLSNFVSANNIFAGNAFNGNGPGGENPGGTTTLNNMSYSNDIIIFSGCGERYPLQSANLYDKTNYHSCHDGGSAGQGDGLGCQAGNCICSGNFTVTNSDISFNTQDNIDNLHCSGVGNFKMYRTRTEGGAGQQLKINQANADVENSLIIGDCYFFGVQNTQLSPTSYGHEYCRGGGDAIRLVPYPGHSYNFSNNTILGTGPAIFEYEQCSQGSEIINFTNNNWIGGWNTPVYGNNAKATLFDPEVAVGCPSGSPGENLTPIQENYDHVWNTSNQALCEGNHSICNDSSAGVTGNLTNALGPSNYYSGTDLGHLLYPNPTGTLVGAANTGVTLTGTSNDFNNVSRGSVWDIGGFQNNSKVPTGFFCNATPECNSTTCTNNICGAQTGCLAVGSVCTAPGDCCTQTCNPGGVCGNPLLGNGSACTNNNQCSSGNCCNNACNASACVVQVCGNHIQEGTEGADDGNLINGDGVSSLCQIEGPNELPLTYDSSDPNGNLNIMTNSIDFNNIDRNFSPYVRKDFGVNFFGDTWSDTFVWRIDSGHDNSGAGLGNGAVMSPWSKTVNPQTSLTSIKNTKEGITLSYFYLNGTNGGGPLFNITLTTYATGAAVSGTSISLNFVPGTVYPKVYRTGGNVIAEIYQDAARTNLLGTTTVADNVKYRYFAPFYPQNDGTTGTSLSGNVGSYVLTSASAFCGDHICQANEFCNTCPQDCNVCPITPSTTTKCTITGTFNGTGVMSVQ